MIGEILAFFNDQTKFKVDHFKMVVWEIAHEKFFKSRFLKQPKEAIQDVHIDFNGELYSRIHFQYPNIGFKEMMLGLCC
jgi:hypothetical protein